MNVNVISRTSTFILALTGLLSIEAAAQLPRIIVDVDPANDIVRSGNTHSQDRAYRAGYSAGLQDGRDERTPSYRRHLGGFPERHWSMFRSGYDQGYRRSISSSGDRQRFVYREGYRRGYDDAVDFRRADISRHRRDVPGYESTFRRGYESGYQNGQRERQPAVRRAGNQAYENGFVFGKRDRQRGRSSKYSRHSDSFSERTESDFRRGYLAGYQDR